MATVMQTGEHTAGGVETIFTLGYALTVHKAIMISPPAIFSLIQPCAPCSLHSALPYTGCYPPVTFNHMLPLSASPPPTVSVFTAAIHRMQCPDPARCPHSALLLIPPFELTGTTTTEEASGIKAHGLYILKTLGGHIFTKILICHGTPFEKLLWICRVVQESMLSFTALFPKGPPLWSIPGSYM